MVNYFEYWWKARNDNYVLFYGCILLAFGVFFWAYKIIRKRQTDKAKIVNSKKEQLTKTTDLTKVESKSGTASIKTTKEESDRITREKAEKIIREKKAKLEAERIVSEIAALQRKIADEKTANENDEEIKGEKLPGSRQTTTPYINSKEVEVKIIESIPDPGKSEPKRIGYLPTDIFVQPEPYQYAVVKMPKKNSLIKFPRKGRSNKKGFKEDDFFIELNKYFKNDFKVFNDKHIPTENGRPYEPDLIISNEKENKNIFINIEIDEPYEGWTRTPSHCIGENNLRDDFFTNRGWIVIRFAEIQIHLEPQKCCALIAKVIASIDPNYKSELLNEISPTKLNQWDNLRAKRWAAEKYREKYLKITDFGERPNVITEYIISDSEADKEVEKEAPKSNSIIADVDGLLAKKNKNDRDKRITFDPIKHRYFIDGNPDTISVTQLIDKFFPEFDSEYWAPKTAAKRGITTEDILAEWETKRVDSANKGTALHAAIENHYEGKEHNSSTPEFKQFLAFKLKYSSMIPFRSEWRIFDEDLLIAGTIDMVFFKEDGSLYMFDWKRSEKVVNSDGTIQNPTFQYAFDKLSHLGDNSYNKYCLQLNIYRAILEKRYGHKISSMNLLVMHQSYDRFHLVSVPAMDKEVKHIFSCALAIK